MFNFEQDQNWSIDAICQKSVVLVIENPFKICNVMYIFIKWWGHYEETSLFTCNRVEKIFFCFMKSWLRSLWRYGTADLLYLSVFALFTTNLSGYLVLIVWPPSCLGKKLKKFSCLANYLVIIFNRGSFIQSWKNLFKVLTNSESLKSYQD